MAPRLKKCAYCGELKDRQTAFSQHTGRKAGQPFARCKKCCNRQKYLRQQYGLTMDEDANLFNAQWGRCALCALSGCNLQLDHDHDCCRSEKSCGLCIRGLLCPDCNRGFLPGYERARGRIPAVGWLEDYLSRRPIRDMRERVECGAAA